jgi:hypothetical protein
MREERETVDEHLHRLLREQQSLISETVGFVRELHEYLGELRRTVLNPRAGLMEQKKREYSN